MPEGPQVARYARLQARELVGRAVAVDAPSGRSDEVAALFDGATLRGIEAIGKHLLYDFGEDRLLHVHLGRFGTFRSGPMPLPEVRGIVRLRMWTSTHWFELRGAIAVEPFDANRRALLEGRIGPNPLDPDADIDAAYAKIARSRRAIGLLLMDQSIVGGIGNIYRSEALFLNGVHPRAPGSSLSRAVWGAMWTDLVRVMADGAKVGRIVTTHAADRAKPSGIARREDRFYTYHRTGRPCRRCGTPIEEMTLGNRRVFFCPHDQPAPPFPESEDGSPTGATHARSRLAARVRQGSTPKCGAKRRRASVGVAAKASSERRKGESSPT